MKEKQAKQQGPDTCARGETKVEEVKKFLRLPTLLALAALAFVVALLLAAQGIAQNGSPNQAPNTTATVEGAAPAATAQEVKPAKDFYAVVRRNGTLARDRGAVDAQRITEGQYAVIFFRNVRNCAYVATIGTPRSVGLEAPGEITVAGLFENPQGVFVSTHDSTGAFAARAFHLQVSC
jgi:hypothetical protein